MRDFQQIIWDDSLQGAALPLIQSALAEDMSSADCTTLALVPPGAQATAQIVARKPGVVAGLPVAQLLINHFAPTVRWEACVCDGEAVEPGDRLATLSGPAQALLTIERPILNFVGHLSGIATTTRHYVQAIANTSARIYDTRKTLPGWRLLEKYAVRCGGGHNHRLNLAEAILIKDNHLALGAQANSGGRFSPAEAVVKARAYLAQQAREPRPLLEIEVDSLDQFREVLTVGPDLILLDNMPSTDLAAAVAMRNQLAPLIELEASGGVNLDTVRHLALAGVDRISVGALTHSAPWFDVGLDWK